MGASPQDPAGIPVAAPGRLGQAGARAGQGGFPLQPGEGARAGTAGADQGRGAGTGTREGAAGTGTREGAGAGKGQGERKVCMGQGLTWSEGDPTFAPATIAPTMISPATKSYSEGNDGF